jgi:hypothetical protein
MELLGAVLASIICLTIFGTFYHSILSRRTDGVTKRLHQARMNLYMGAMFLAIGGLQFLLPGYSPLRVSLILLIMGIGLVNLYYGLKNLRHFGNVAQNPEEAK